VDEHAAVSDDDLTPGPAAKLLSTGMWLPVLGHADGYGFTYGARVSFVNVLGGRSRLSVPLTWGGERRAAVEAERQFAGPLPVLRGSLALSRRVNPHYELPDLRQEARIEAERALLPWLRAGTSARVAQVAFGRNDDARHSAAGVHAVVDTRVDPSFPRNALHARIGWEHAWFGGAALPGRRAPATGANRWVNDVRGYVGVGGSAVLALRAQLIRSDAALPPAEQSLLGGSETVRGYRMGHRAGDSLAAVSAELRVPVNSPLSVGRLGVKAFVDAGTVWNDGQRLRDRPFDRGIGGGIYLGAAAVMADVDVAWPKEGGARAHFGLGVSF
jgi:outer membrane protein assembly factor BamA